MATLRELFAERLSRALGDRFPDVKPEVVPTADARHGDYQSNVAMLLAKKAGVAPRALAQEIVDALEVSDLAEPPQIAGPGFLNFRLRPEFLARRTRELLDDPKLGAGLTGRAKKMVIDFSSPNVAKSMHVGHIRSTILGDAISRIAEFLGHDVVRDNHIGDWGTQFGMLLVGWKTDLNREALAAEPIAEMERLYKKISALCKEDESVQQAARAELVKLQSGDGENLAIWKEMIRLSQTQFDSIYQRLGVRFDVTLGESFYNPWLKGVVADLVARGIARESDGAICVFSDGSLPDKDDPFRVQRQGEWVDIPAIVQKEDGAANYTTTDLATLQYRLEKWAPDEIVYVTDGRQQLHFRQLFAIFRRWKGEAASRVRLAHVWFGTILGEDNKPFKTRSGETIKLKDLLDEAEKRAFDLVRGKNPDLGESECREIARIVGLGAIKYADLLPARQSDYVFSWDRMLSFNGNTAPYLQYSSVRIRSIFRKLDGPFTPPETLTLTEPAEIALAKKLLQFGETVPLVLEEFRPNLLANYLYELAGMFHSFFEACPVLKSEEPVRSSRLVLCELAARTINRGLGLLGIECPEKM
jgi:arginyl-tRNA synthetase